MIQTVTILLSDAPQIHRKTLYVLRPQHNAHSEPCFIYLLLYIFIYIFIIYYYIILFHIFIINIFIGLHATA